MPHRMQQALENEKRNPKKVSSQEFTFQPMVNEVKTGAQFKKMQDKFQEKLNKTKGANTVTKIQQFKFEDNAHSRPLKRTYVNEGPQQSLMAAATGGDKLKEKLANKPQSAKTRSSVSGAPAKQPSSTRSNVLLQQRRREELEAQKAKQEAKDKEDADRKAKQTQVSQTIISCHVFPLTFTIFYMHSLKIRFKRCSSRG